MLSPTQKNNIIGDYSRHKADTGSSEVQIALFSKEIDRLTKHLKKHPKDNSSRTGLLKMVSKRKRLLDYLKKNQPRQHSKIIKKLGLKR
ncbi:MAG: 30S ribosomal protein S15 [Candidatus Yanofskybacteria bacterium CG10_big_fil_rev_8_21_14_0_10_36_16]|uniref:Small ribosomal subunit protein uS15 n=1 Tax=Candidatus Yanofskybacteria bacterium CG10_big_fil_rev_8_21_14_0_10_36_16 TaxID=1975096 RepID=A0A2J0Q7X7_9BACT|nr:MAG: 30S ribosomal protein S15 [Candidatus Yanofskybacteria bacterium CG10_big_fil_rev_8_21_14_0_10_36_16]